jgi:NADH-quinone oxidoreductase subunit K
LIAAIGPSHYLAVSALLLVIGTIGVLLRRNLIVILMSIELMLNAVNINLVMLSRHHGHANGQVFSLMVMTIAVSEAAVALSVLIALYRNRGTILVDELDLLKG